MSRLAKGERAEVDKKSMRQLTSKNYELLPEVKKKKERANVINRIAHFIKAQERGLGHRR